MSLELAWPWVLAAVLVVAAGVVAWAWRARRRRAVGRPGRWVANTAYLDAVPGVRRALTVYRLVRGAGVAALVVAVAGAGVLGSRPVEREVTTDRIGSRDIVLCLDVSGSMVPFDSAIVQSFAALVEDFAGERIALSIFNSSSRTVFPLTDDYDLVLEELAAADAALAFDLEAFDPQDTSTWGGFDEFLAFSAGTQGATGASLIGDGLASCAQLFDEQQTDRSRSIILATDNDVNGEPVYSLPEAVDVVTARDVRLYGLYGGDVLLRGSPQNEEFVTSIEGADGRAWFAEDPEAVAGILRDVTAEQAVAVGDDRTALVVERPAPWFPVVLAGVLLLLLVRWRLRE
ncbi:MAG: hypothetical protein JWP95_1808 [Actinotalea sp.]|nr:hypothetical protein [Actinotalea sp.]